MWGSVQAGAQLWVWVPDRLALQHETRAAGSTGVVPTAQTRRGGYSPDSPAGLGARDANPPHANGARLSLERVCEGLRKHLEDGEEKLQRRA
ncbi:unnamed protein product [Lepidochelys olivacea]